MGQKQFCRFIGNIQGKKCLDMAEQYYQTSMLKREHPKNKPSKKSLQSINKFHYYIEELYPTLTSTLDECWGRSTITHNANLHVYQQIHKRGRFTLNREQLLQCGCMVYGGSACWKLYPCSFHKSTSIKVPYLPIWHTANQLLDLVAWEEAGTTTLYIVHHCHAPATNPIKWHNFVEQFRVNEQGLTYQYSVCYPKSTSFTPATNENLMLSLLSDTCVGGAIFQQMEGMLIQCTHRREEIRSPVDPAYQHNVMEGIPSQHLPAFYELKSQLQVEDSLICRYLLKNSFQVEATRAGVKKYLCWRAQITSKYKWEDFVEFHRMEIFNYLGEDKMGRPVILNRAAKVLVDQIDVEKYCAFYIYFMEIYLPSKMRGTVTQVLIIADVAGLSMKNFKLAVTRRNMQDADEYNAERQYKIIAVNVASFAVYWWHLVKSFVPKNVVRTVSMLGDSVAEIRDVLLKDMDEEIIPEYLGGKNIID